MQKSYVAFLSRNSFKKGFVVRAVNESSRTEYQYLELGSFNVRTAFVFVRILDESKIVFEFVRIILYKVRKLFVFDSFN